MLLLIRLINLSLNFTPHVKCVRYSPHNFTTRYHLKNAVLEGGIPFNKAYGVTSFEYYGKDARCNQLFNEGMKSQTVIITKKLIEFYRGFDDVNILVDVGGGTGATLGIITSSYNHIKGINFDLPHVIHAAPALPGSFLYWEMSLMQYRYDKYLYNQ